MQSTLGVSLKVAKIAKAAKIAKGERVGSLKAAQSNRYFRPTRSLVRQLALHSNALTPSSLGALGCDGPHFVAMR